MDRTSADQYLYVLGVPVYISSYFGIGECDVYLMLAYRQHGTCNMYGIVQCTSMLCYILPAALNRYGRVNSALNPLVQLVDTNYSLVVIWQPHGRLNDITRRRRIFQTATLLPDLVNSPKWSHNQLFHVVRSSSYPRGSEWRWRLWAQCWTASERERLPFFILLAALYVRTTRQPVCIQCYWGEHAHRNQFSRLN